MNDAFPLELGSSTKDIQARLAVVEGLTGEVGAKYAKQITALLYELNDRNQSLMPNFRSIYLVYQADPCGMSGFLADKVWHLVDKQERLNEHALKLRGLVELVRAHPDQTTAFIERFMSIINALGTVSPELESAAASLVIEDNRQAAKTWIKPPTGEGPAR